jgi:hypothetical protein
MTWRVASGFPRELARGSGCRARSAQRQLNVAQRTEGVLSGDHRAKDLADTFVIGMRPCAVTEARHVPECLLGALDHRSDLGTARRIGERVESGPDALERIRQRLPYAPSNLCQRVGEIRVFVIAHNCIFSPGRSKNQAGQGLDDRCALLSGSVVQRYLPARAGNAFRYWRHEEERKLWT